MAALRNYGPARAKVPGCPQWMRGIKSMWVPEARYRKGYWSRNGHRAAGWQIPQPWVVDTAGATVRLDDAVGARWAVLYTGEPPSGCRAWRRSACRSIRIDQAGSGQGTIVDADGTLTALAGNKKASAVVACARTDSSMRQPIRATAAASTSRIRRQHHPHQDRSDA